MTFLNSDAYFNFEAVSSLSFLFVSIDNFKETLSASFVILFKYCKFREQYNHALDSAKGSTL